MEFTELKQNNKLVRFMLQYAPTINNKASELQVIQLANRRLVNFILSEQCYCSWTHNSPKDGEFEAFGGQVKNLLRQNFENAKFGWTSDGRQKATAPGH